MKVSGSEWLAFWSAAPETAYFEDAEILVNGEEEDDSRPIVAGDLVTVSGGQYFPSDSVSDRDNYCSLPRKISAWLKTQKQRTVSVSVDADKFDQMVALLKTIGAKVL